MEAEKQLLLKHVFKDIKDINGFEVQYGDEKEHFKFIWQMLMTNYDDYCSFGVSCDPECEEIEKYLVDTEFEFRLIGEKQVLTTKGIHCHNENDMGYGDIMTISEPQMEQYLIDGNLTIECHVKILKMEGFVGKKSKFSEESMKKYSDVVLVVDGEKFYVSKGYLASRSPYFDTLLMGQFKESNQSEVVLHGVEVDDFQNFFEILYAEAKLTDQNVESVLRVADMYETKCVLKRAEEFLLEVSMKSKKEKFELALKYNLKDVKVSILSQCNDAADIRSLLPDDLNQLDKGTMAELFKKHLSATTSIASSSK